jgi:hypothetical protein
MRNIPAAKAVVCSLWNTLPLSSLCTFPPERIPVSRVSLTRQTKKHWETAVPGKQHKLQSENVMGGLYLGIAFTGVNALIATGLVIAFM